MERLILREEGSPTVAGRTITLRLCTIGRLYTVGRAGRTVLRERVEPGAFTEPLARPRGVLRFVHTGEHDGEADSIDNFHGILTALREEAGVITADFEMFEGAREDKMLRLAESGAVTGASMSAIVAGSKKLRDAAGPFTSVTRIRQINGASLTPTPAYDDAGIVAIREDAGAAARRLRAIEAGRTDQERARRMLREAGIVR
jgi:phage head maturation protease